MHGEHMETLCARICLLGALEREEGMPSPLRRSEVRRMIESGALDALVLRESEPLSGQKMEQAKALLSRSSSVCMHIERYLESGYTALLPESDLWPRRLEKLGGDMPLYLFAKGTPDLLKGRLIAVAGSRSISAETTKKAERIGRILAQGGMTVVSGGAQGVDSIVQNAALRAGGSVVIVPAQRDTEILRQPMNRRAMEEGRLLLLCETPPDEPFSARKALTRNHTIYALGDCAMVIASRKGIGGSWAGACACLRGGWSPVYILDDEGPDFQGNSELIRIGALRMQISEGTQKDELLLEGMSEDILRRYGLLRIRTLFDAEG